MKHSITTIETPVTVSTAQLIARRTEATRQALFFSLLRAKKDVPMNSLTAKTLGLLYSHVYGVATLQPGTPPAPATAQKLVDSAIHLASGFLKAAEAVDLLSRANRFSILKMISDQTALGNIILSNVGLTGDTTITPDALVDMIMRGEGHGPRGSELEVLRHAGRWAEIPVSTGTSMNELLAAATLTRYRETWLRYISQPQGLALIDISGLNGEAAALAVIRTLRSQALNLVAAPLAANVALLQHVAAVVQHPWFKNVLDVNTFISVQQQLEVVKHFDIMQTAWADWSELQKPDVWDADLIQPIKLMGLNPGDIPERMVDVTGWSDQPLAAELKGPVSLAAAAGVQLLSIVRDLVERARTLNTLARAAAEIGGDVTQYGGDAVDLSAPDPLLARIPAHIGQTVGYPIVTAYDVWNPAPPTVAAAVRVLDLQRKDWYTTAYITALTNRAYDGLQPVFVAADPAAALPLVKPMIRPVIEGWSDNGLYLQPSRDALTKLWNTSPTELARTLSVLPNDPNATILRELADALRFVGVLYIRRAGKTKNDGAVALVRPHVQHWYHYSGEMFGEMIAGIRPENVQGEKDAESRLAASRALFNPSGLDAIELGTLSKTRDTLMLLPFSNIPSSCIIDASPQALRELDYFQTLQVHSLLRWISNEPVQGLWPIKGWSIPEASAAFGDIVAVRMPMDSGSYLEIKGLTDIKPMYVSRANAINELMSEQDSTTIQPATVGNALGAEGPII